MYGNEFNGAKIEPQHAHWSWFLLMKVNIGQMTVMIAFAGTKWVKVYQMEMLQKEPRSLRQNVHSATL